MNFEYGSGWEPLSDLNVLLVEVDGFLHTPVARVAGSLACTEQGKSEDEFKYLNGVMHLKI